MRLLFVLCDFYISGLSAERIKRFAAVLVELSEKFNILQTAGVNESTQRVDGQVENMADDDIGYEVIGRNVFNNFMIQVERYKNL